MSISIFVGPLVSSFLVLDGVLVDFVACSFDFLGDVFVSGKVWDHWALKMVVEHSLVLLIEVALISLVISWICSFFSSDFLMDLK
jgi:hypothetical protein